MKVHDPPENSRSDEPAPSIEEFLRKKDELDRAIRDRFQKPIAVVFTDIAASTDYFERRGDLAGRLMLQRHHDLLRPIVEDHGGRILKTLGDGWMISFEDPVRAALAAAEMQRRLSLENRRKEPADQVRIKIGMHWGLGFVEETDIYGDVPNTAARLCSLAKGGDILISSSFAQAVRQSPQVSHEYAGVKTLKGKAQPLDVYRILWDPCQEPDARRTIPRESARRNRRESPLCLAFSLEDEAVCIHVAWGEEGAGESRIFRIPFREKEIWELVEEIDRCLGKVDSRGKVSKEQVRGLKDLGANLHEILVPRDLASLILDLAPDTLLCRIDPSLVHVPWEFLHDGETFFCLKYGMGRTALHPTAPDVPSRKPNPSSQQVLIVADPQGDLAAAGAEGISVRRVFTRADIPGMKVFLKGREATCAFIESHLSKADLFHFAGHADYDPSDPSLSGFFLADGKFETGRLPALARKGGLPLLVFANACESGRTHGRLSGERVHGLASGFLLSGVRHYIGSTLDLFDRSSAAFAEEFYARLMQGRSVGDSLRHARLQSIAHYGEETLTWASYVLHGDPAYRFPIRAEARDKTSFFRPRPWKRVMGIGAAILVGLALILSGLPTRREGPPVKTGQKAAQEVFQLLHQGQALRAQGVLSSLEDKSPLYHQGLSALALAWGGVEEARAAWESARSGDPESPYLLVLAARIALAEGNLEEAGASFRKALSVETLQPWQRAEVHLGLGRILMKQGFLDQAVAEFDRALEADPSFLQAYTAKGLALERSGKLDAAVAVYEKGTFINSDEPVNLALYRRSCREREIQQDEERKKRIDALVAELIQQQEKVGAAPVRDEWTSRPLFLCFLNLEPRGQPAPREGEDEFLSQLVAGDLAESSRLQMVERALLERVLEELRLSSSRLADPQSALRLGRILSARILCTGSLVRHKGQVRMNLRAVDTETTQVVATASGVLPRNETPFEAVREISRQLRQRLLAAYPLRCRIQEVQGSLVLLDGGSLVGLRPDTRMRVVEREGKGIELVVREVSADSSIAVPSPTEARLQPGWRVEELPSPGVE